MLFRLYQPKTLIHMLRGGAVDSQADNLITIFNGFR